ncbi:DUF2155 domain-containing protein [Primorskyibacter flagellatus]|uniref:DUF2155 domain-containing protein n=1 Tax=Primorskyibacter flagellatus TaxID=1387277 RepID=A0A1W2E3H1_9RHOB|nr:DUF2155 domain-containing protein [Primorskyibacter flagellatus]SMD04265.1 hypothetical protein SAMN06295998_12164 [Primorskyibacter flagellatus]
MIRAAMLCLLIASPAAAQEAVVRAPGAVLRGLDKVSGAVSDLDMRNGERGGLGRLTITLRECRYPAGDPAGNAYAFLDIVEEGRQDPVFSGWMIASAPALNPLDHARYDVWVLRCKTS